MYYVGEGIKQESTKAVIYMYMTECWVVFSQVKQAYLFISKNKNNLKGSK